MTQKNFLPKALAVVLLTLAVYFPALRGEFVWDDNLLVTENAMVKAKDGLYRLWFTTEPVDYFPAMSTSFWLEWRLWGMNPTGYHVTNVLLHAAAAILLWQVLGRLRVPGAWLAGLVFAVHPVNVQSVAWISERKNTLCMAFYAASLLAYLKFDQGGPRRWYALALGLFLLALLSKTAVVMGPVALLGCAWWQRGKISAKDLLRSAPFFALSLVLGLTTVWFQFKRGMGGAPIELSSPLSRLPAASWAVWFYLFKAVAPVGLCTVYPGWDPSATAGLSIWPALLLGAVFVLLWIYRKSWGRPLLFGLGYYAVMLLPILGFVKMYIMQFSLVVDHFQYPAIIGPIALLIGLAAFALEKSRAHLGRFVPVAGAALVALLGLHTWQQAHIYENSESLWRHTLTENEVSWVAHFNLAGSLIGQGMTEDALAHFQESARLKPDHALSQFHVGNALMILGREEEAEPFLRRALALWPECYAAHYNLANMLVQQGKLEEAAAHYQAVLKGTPKSPEVHNNFARLLASQGKIEEAIAHYRTALEHKPDSPLILDNLAWVLACHEDPRFRDGVEAVRLAEQALKAGEVPDVKTLDTLAAAYAETGRFEDAARCAQKALDLASSSGKKEKAEQIRRRLELYRARKPIRLGPDIPLESVAAERAKGEMQNAELKRQNAK